MLLFLAPVEMSKWSVKVRKCYRKIKTNDLSDEDIDYVDIDEVLGMYMEEFKNCKKTL